jgi:DNA-binding NarL/FixJ family response regulator
MRILIVDDHTLFRDGLKLLLGKLDQSIETLDASDLPSALEAAGRLGPIDLVLFDLGLPGVSGIQALTEFRQVNTGLPVVVLSGLADRRTVIEALENGAMGFIPKTTSSDALYGALKLVLDGGIYLPEGAWESPKHGAVPRSVPAVKRLSELDLTERQRQVFKLIIQGRPNKVIARELGVTESTVKAHIKPILKALNVTSRVGAILEVGHLGVLLD